jgi:hypothetical protein
MNSKRARGLGFMNRAKLMELLPRHEKCTPQLIQDVIETSDVLLENRGSAVATKAYRMARQVGNEFHRARSFTRTQVNERGVLYGKMTVKHRIEDLVLKFFHSRFPEYIIILYNVITKQSHIITEKRKISVETLSLEESVAKWSKDRPIIAKIADLNQKTEQIEELSQAEANEKQILFEEFYLSQYAPERKNKKYFDRMMPKYWRRTAGMEMENGFGNTKLEQFFGAPKKEQKAEIKQGNEN